MAGESKDGKKRSIGDEEVAGILRRYSADTVLTLLREIWEVAGEKIDWHEVVKNTATGITSARECQILWRHMAYGEALIDSPGDDAALADDDSDLEVEMEASPAPDPEALFVTAAYVKALKTSGRTDDSDLSNEAPLIINIPNLNAFDDPSAGSLHSSQGVNISIPVSLPSQMPSGSFREARPSSGLSGSHNPPRRRRDWSTDENMKLTAAIQKHGEGNWTVISRIEFLNDRSASDISKRWDTMKKKQGDSNLDNSSQAFERQLAATNQAVSLALNMPVGENSMVAAQKNPDAIKCSHQPQMVPASKANQQPERPVAPPKSQGLEATRSLQSISALDISTGGSTVNKMPSHTSIDNQLPSNAQAQARNPADSKRKGHVFALPAQVKIQRDPGSNQTDNAMKEDTDNELPE